MAKSNKNTKTDIPAPYTKEQVAEVSVTQFNGGLFPVAVGKYLRQLPVPTDDLEAELGIDVYDRMMNDAQVNAAAYTSVHQVLSNGVQVVPACGDPSDPRYKLSIEISDYIKRMMDNVSNSGDIFGDYASRSYMEIMEDVAMARVKNGHCAADMTFGVGKSGKLSNMAVLQWLAPKTPYNYRFVVDKFGKVPYLYVWNGNTLNAPAMGTVNAENKQSVALLQQENVGWNLVPASKFFITTHRPLYGDPRGTSMLRPAYQSWYMLQNVWPEYHKFLVQMAGGIWKGTCAQDAVAVDDGNGGVVLPTQAMSKALDDLYNGATIALKFGNEVEGMWPNGDGSAFRLAIAELNHQIVKAILLSILSTDTSQNQSGAASRVHKDVSDLSTLSFKRSFCDAQRQQIWKPLVALNFGVEAANELTPTASLGRITPEDRASVVAALAAAGFILSPTQQQYISAELEIPQPTPEETTARLKTLINAATAPTPTSGAQDAKSQEQRKQRQENTRNGQS